MPDLLTKNAITKYLGKREYGLLAGDTVARVHIGGKDEVTGGKFVPIIYAAKFRGTEDGLKDDEAWLSINHADTVVSGETESFADGAVSLTVGDVTHAYYPLNDDWLEYETVLANRPGGDKVSWELHYPVGLRFEYQAQLTPEEIDFGAARPDDIVGSYAVCWKDSNNIKNFGGTTKVKYGTGKFCHIKRPRVSDDSGTNATWGVLTITETEPGIATMEIAIPSAWLDTAVFPITVDPTFGFSGDGASTFAGSPNYRAATGTFAPAAAGTTDSVHCLAGADESSTPITLGIWNDDGSQNPTTLVVDTAGGNGADSAWFFQNTDSAAAVSSSSLYHIGRNHGNQQFTYKYDSDAAIDYNYESAAYSAGSLGNFGTPVFWQTYKVSWYVTYTESGGETAEPSAVPAAAAVPAPSLSLSLTGTAFAAAGAVPAPTLALSLAVSSVAAAAAAIPAVDVSLTTPVSPSAAAASTPAAAYTLSISQGATAAAAAVGLCTTDPSGLTPLPFHGIDVSGILSMAEDLMIASLANAAAFQTWCGAANADEALQRIYLEGLPPPAADAYTVAELNAYRPFALVWSEAAGGLRLRMDAVDTVWKYSEGGVIIAYLEQRTPTDHLDDPSSMRREITNSIGDIIDDVLALSGTAGYLAVRNMALHGPYRSQLATAPAQDDVVGFYLDCHWGNAS